MNLKNNYLELVEYKEIIKQDLKDFQDIHTNYLNIASGETITRCKENMVQISSGQA